MNATRYLTFTIVCIAVGVGYRAHAYEINTHRDLTQAAVERSILQLDPTILRNLGLDKGINDPTQQFPNSKNEPRTIRRLLQDGTEFEDNVSLIPLEVRVVRHFYNPLTGEGLRAGVISATASPDWALARRGSDPQQQFSYWDARQYLFDSLTKQSEADRKRAFGLTFQTLGHVMHHLQDMAVPQHVRNDAHCPSLACILIGVGFAPSLFEDWTEENRGSLSKHLNPGSVGYDIASSSFTLTFNSPRRLWHTELPGPNSPAVGKGIAEFTNRNFVSIGTNFDKPPQPSPPNFALPAFDPNNKTEPTVAELCANANPPCPPSLLALPQARLTFYGSVGFDNFLQTPVPNPRASTESIFTEFLEPLPQDLGRIFSLNRFNFDEAYKHLIPRAVAYSAGLVNHFFRGRLDAEPQGPGTLLVKNLSPEAMQGDFGLYYDDAQGNRFPVAVTACRVGAVDVPVDQSKCKNAALVSVSTDAAARLEVNFDAPVSPSPKNPGEYMLVFNGKLGEETPELGSAGAVVGKLVTNPYNGVLYIAGEDSARRLIFFKIDRSGISNITGINPLEGLFFNQSPREKAYHFKQASVTVTPSGTLLHKTVALATRRSNTLGDLSFVSDPVSGALRPVSGIAWTAQSPHPTVGSFEFGLSIIDFAGRQANLFYTRRFTNAQGQPAQTTGVLRLPDLPTNAGYLYSDFSKGGLLLNGEGTEIYPRGGAPFRRYGVRITLADTPTAALFDLPQGTSSFTSKPATSASTSLGQCSVDHLGILPNGQTVPMTTSAPHSRFESVARDQESTSESMVIEDFTGGELLTYLNRSHGRQFESTVTETCEAKALDWTIFGNPQAKVNLLRRQQSQRIFRVLNEHVLRDGSLQYVTTNVNVRPASAGYSCGVGVGPVAVAIWVFGNSYVDLNYSYNGFAPCPIQTADEYVSGDDPANPKKRIYRALTHRLQDAVYFEDEAGFSVVKFRDELLVPGPGFVADASPIGEVFVAKRDLSLIVHEPKPGNMPVLTRELIPAEIVRLLAAVWM